MNYASIKDLAKETNVTTESLIVLARQNDPFYVGAPAQLKQAHWFAGLWEQFNFKHGVHIRRIHYKMISGDSPVHSYDGSAYENTDLHWRQITQASKLARYLDLVPVDAFTDRRAPAPALYATGDAYYAERVEAEACGGLIRDLPAMPYLPWISAQTEDYLVGKPTGYHVELWCEKSTVNDVLIPLCSRNECNLVTGLGEMSVTAVKSLFHRVSGIGLPVRILYLSDFDPGGLSMPVAVARKCEFFLQERPDIDLKLQPILLSADQVREYELPRIPIKDTERRRGRFEDAHGEGAVELDAMEAIHPGELRRLVAAEISRFRDDSIDAQINDVIEEAERDCLDITTDVLEEFTAEIAAAKASFAEAIEPQRAWIKQHDQLWCLIREEMENRAGGQWELPQPVYGEDYESPLYDSSRSYMEQLAHYKSFQHK